MVPEPLLREDPAHVHGLVRGLVTREVAPFGERRHGPTRRKADRAVLRVEVLHAGESFVHGGENRRRAPCARSAALRLARDRVVEEVELAIVALHHLRDAV